MSARELRLPIKVLPRVDSILLEEMVGHQMPRRGADGAKRETHSLQILKGNSVFISKRDKVTSKSCVLLACDEGQRWGLV